MKNKICIFQNPKLKKDNIQIFKFDVKKKIMTLYSI